MKGVAVEGLDAVEGLTAFCELYSRARLSAAEDEYTGQRYEPGRVTISLSGNPVAFPSGAFLQATADGEAMSH